MIKRRCLLQTARSLNCRKETLRYVFARRYYSVDPPTISSRGKKLRPEKPNIVILDPKQIGHSSKHPHPHHNRGQQNSILEGFDFEFNSISEPLLFSKKASKNVSHPQEDHQDLIQRETEKLLNFETKLNEHQFLESIESFKPVSKVNDATHLLIDTNTYNDLKSNLSDSFTWKQLYSYIKFKSNLKSKLQHMVKIDLINKIFFEIWNCKISESSDNQSVTSPTSSDLVTLRIKLSERGAKLLILTDNGKILKNLTRLKQKVKNNMKNSNLSIELNLSQYELLITSNESISKFIEISINNILKNIIVTNWDFPSIKIENFEKCLDLITKICAVDIDLEKNEIAAFGMKRIQLATRLVNWVISNDTLNKMERLEDWSSKNDRKWFPFNDVDSLNWFAKNETWGRLQTVIPINSSKKLIESLNMVSEDKIDRLYEFFTVANDDKYQSKLNFSKDSIFNNVSISLGTLIQNVSGEKHIFQSKLPQITSKLLDLPLYDKNIPTVDQLFSVDSHDYYLELSFAPPITDEFTSHLPPIKLWLELDEFNNTIPSSIQCFMHLLNKEALIQTSHLPHDYKITVDKISSLLPLTSVGNKSTLIDQHGIKVFIDKFRFLTIKNFKSTSQLNVNLVIDDKPINIDYNFITLNHYRILRLKYMDKYLLQFSENNGGKLGGRSAQIDFLLDAKNNEMSRKDFGIFVRDIFRF
ncbi:hypothetical protein KAFR_0H02180 [Kazachstania africana CBS 2517]|uniref:Uncharacterized protein n=1 Tax=Kazachstania africana (strain ATCC 22294 / BCRC 22015 / CBS 2517 / CECT 1963 / NBRC 1671 / NRRL Y-8276) TaxID=1071382 RepID=H2AZ71_KAZAF|nr:hypothetical protein KAFR_0H02180 [Kazachstania africana CBS 2517]CCF59627.1 hypothetical protein KAFR_0H02180 [Kazachstania africana CBS 2517]